MEFIQFYLTGWATIEEPVDGLNLHAKKRWVACVEPSALPSRDCCAGLFTFLNNLHGS